MAFDANGTFTRWGGDKVWQGDSAAGTLIESGRHDSHDQEIANGLSKCLTRMGAGVPSADIPWGGKKITNLGNPTQPGDAATKGYVDVLPGWEKSKYISGADLDGRLNFTAPSGVNGITWTYADVSWIARHSVASKYSSRLAMNSSVAPNTTGDPVGDVFFIDDGGRINNSGWLTSNGSYDGAAWRAISPGTVTSISYSSGSVRLASNDVATITNPYAVATLREYMRFVNNAGNAQLQMVKSASGKTNQILSYMGTGLRWQMQLGEGTAETAAGGSHFYLSRYNNAGTAFGALHIARDTGVATFYGNITTSGSITSGSNFDSTSTTCILSATNGGSIYLRPDGPTVAISGLRVDTSGNVMLNEGSTSGLGGLYAGQGLHGRAGSTGAYGSSWMNFNYSGGFVYSYVGATLMGAITWQSDYRIKRNITPLQSTWEHVKALNPIKYTHKKYRDLTEDESVERWGLIAHETQAALTKTAAFGNKDEADVLQSINPLTVIAALTKALQEAMERIEVLEAKVPA